MMQIRRVLVPIDGSDLSLKAADAAAELARRFDARITLLTAVDPPETVMAHMDETVMEEVRRGVQQAVEQMVDEAAARLRQQQLEVEARVVWGTPPSAIVAEADAGYDLIVMGSRGMGLAPWDRHFLGSVAERVLRRARCPVLIVPDPTEAGPEGE
jgi:nucleotide-binding universal stress UspA family protein